MTFWRFPSEPPPPIFLRIEQGGGRLNLVIFGTSSGNTLLPPFLFFFFSKNKGVEYSLIARHFNGKAYHFNCLLNIGKKQKITFRGVFRSCPWRPGKIGIDVTVFWLTCSIDVIVEEKRKGSGLETCQIRDEVQDI